ncbi:sensor domain-containing diguanylate cyclase [Qipengyuania sp. XHP0211]|uniref:GGDEF domain-containing protein n=1 Tax=Qipengyuania sp. XHP0211 TaxID=3038079 RepID=UPI00241DD04B|nr:sensor domain-containing diguanylate cyclase [Qipengyuania sp. XHP0211]MDG5750787.1 sensor domain-containing diguanylate cyclase [Qipengyuania sp. XHP0211]
MPTSRVDTALMATVWLLVCAASVTMVAAGDAGAPLWSMLTALVVLGALIHRHAKRNSASALCPPRPQQPLNTSLADELAGIGRWSFDPATERHRWSREFCRIAGLPPMTAPDAACLQSLMPQGLQQMQATLAGHAKDRETYAVEFEIENPQLGTRLLRAQARNMFSPQGVCEQVLMVVRDVTEEYSQVARIEQERATAVREADEARQLANTDALTGLANRRSAMQALDREIMCARQSGDPLALLVFDVDHFKAVNDTHGHTQGDLVLAEIGSIIRRQKRDGQFAARVGGEEFLMILPGANGRAASAAAERLRLAIDHGTRMADAPSVTVSVGHAALGPGDTSLTLFARADEALYAAKRGGRNQVRLAA